MNIKIVIVGAAGRMGMRILALALESGKFDVVAAVEKQNHPDLGKDAGILAGLGTIGVKLSESIPDCGTDVVLDFSQPESADKTIDSCLKNSTALICGTTGLSEKQRAKIKAASEKIPVIYATNMSVGMNVLFSMVGKIADTLGDEYDIEIIEQHHRFKKDAQSGTALTLAENICKETGRNFPDCLTHGRSGKDALREKGTIGMHAVRAGDITGIHSVIFGTLGETIVLNHTANSRDTFVRGALKAAEWLVGKKPSVYSMMDVLGLKD